jgi:hypothetical protein
MTTPVEPRVWKVPCRNLLGLDSALLLALAVLTAMRMARENRARTVEGDHADGR